MKKKLKLPDVTILAATSTEIEAAQLSIRISLHNIEFGEVKLLCPYEPKKKYPDIEYIPISPLNNVDSYNKLIFQDLHKYFKTSHCLIVQADSFVVNARLWKDDFLKFDYIGGPWPDKIQVNPDVLLDLKKNPVGNGGFSLRSRKLVEATAKIDFDSLNFPLKSEDVVICHYLYKKMIDNGISFAPPKLAAQFSMENIDHLYGQDVNTVFGFHGKHMRDYFVKKYVLRASIGEW
tara:strand:+ start:935 stop:1636 length:702 start_codon:yes stop_codon:yes gene_type:complete